MSDQIIGEPKSLTHQPTNASTGQASEKCGSYDEGRLEQILEENPDELRRLLNNRQIQLMAIGGTIGTALFISIGTALYKGGPLSLLLSFVGYCCIMALVNSCAAEMTVLHPVSGGFIRMAGYWVDEAFGFAAGYNFFLYQALTVPFEIVALNLVLGYWRDDIPAAAVNAACVVLAMNVFAVGIFGEAEFWLSGGKVILIFILFFFTFITMVGGNPKHDAYGFRNWRGADGPMAEWHSKGDLGRFEGIATGIIAAEAKRPRIYVKAAFKTIYWRFGLFFIGSAICVGIVIPYNDTTLVDILSSDQSGSAQGVDRNTFPFRGWCQPYAGWVALVWEILMVVFFGYSSFTPWDIANFFQHYAMLILAPCLYIGWKVIKRTKIIPSSEADLVWERPVVDRYEASFTSPPVGFWVEMLQLIGLKRNRKDNVRRPSIT
ncbi:uncharacterized protein N0V89_007380 [Didymosphaeria variabile]|uniref:Amino acid permease/ SLC12A domain-containing protein n=1 Tax=Didymosphaeria variabile TaxID=1932322 RepID=A0A9W8XJB1_9PLEO|nr:uncharacterized protein N0V89_007380 [Didymosphaeria variabile]KAJ4352034.1 hypothetical protein N0V89_007380 [Didymosphaeria variabile]